MESPDMLHEQLDGQLKLVRLDPLQGKEFFILKREERRKARALRGDRTIEGALQAQMQVTLPEGAREPLDSQRIRRRLINACRGIEGNCSASALAEETLKNLY